MKLDYRKIINEDISFFRKFFPNVDDTHHTRSSTGEHYKLFKYISFLFNEITILDLGTNAGESALSFSQNEKNKVITYDIENKCNILTEKNIEFKIMDINTEDINIIKSAKVISLDISHDGVQEKKFTDLLERIEYKGYVICDDIHNIYYPNMNPWWESIRTEKYDITKVGHHWGTGIINYYNDKSVEIIDNI